MKHIILVLSIFLLYSCSKRENEDLINNTFPNAQEDLHKIINSIVNDAETANLEGLKAIHLDSDKFTKFGPRNFNRQDVISTNKSEEDFFGSIVDYKQEVKDLKIDVFGNIAVATYYPFVTFIKDGEIRTASGRQTLVFLKTDDGWKIIHEHGTPKTK